MALVDCASRAVTRRMPRVLIPAVIAALIAAAPDAAARDAAPAPVVAKAQVELKGFVIRFHRNEGEMTQESDPLLDAVAMTVRDHPSLLLIEVQGHCDASEAKRLATARQTAVIEALVARGVDKNRLVARSYGAGAPACQGKDERCRARNRRVEFLVLQRSAEQGHPAPGVQW
jgi:outer membrane protein OmpA-like peptidoglycan-associated protein